MLLRSCKAAMEAIELGELLRQRGRTILTTRCQVRAFDCARSTFGTSAALSLNKCSMASLDKFGT